MRQVVLDTETTGLEIEEGHRVLELGCVEMVDRKITRRYFHHYINPQREIDDGALEVHGITRDFLLDKPKFGDVCTQFIEFVKGAELIIHNAAFDVRFLDAELKQVPGFGPISDYCSVVDSLELARRKHPGQKNSLDALCKRYDVDNSQRQLHGALLDAEILADVYLLLTGGQVSLVLSDSEGTGTMSTDIRRLPSHRLRLKVVRATEEELVRHEKKLADISERSEQGCIWHRLDGAAHDARS
ncbi:MAG: DNA polymerase III subunit epsilon [Gammaproteobacteria bacterium]|nr:DNA polymerase III subunit epsilon [Gammaproteobacteria bacterium]RPG25082.1 MAG: DNA polymerase III subunit epsilon [Gammaproteobacteria bacterium TMED50]|tara:strand:- start:25956 stop:26684 length:729 start_codon:yes stop_codon:yes gene_type:complete